MTVPDYFKEPYHIIEAKLELAELTIKLGEVTREKWKRHAAIGEILAREEELIKVISDKTEQLKRLQKDVEKKT